MASPEPVAVAAPATCGTPPPLQGRACAAAWPGDDPLSPAATGGLPADLRVVERAPATGWAGYHGPVVVLVHGALDRADSFARAALRLREWAVVTYDRRGYQGSRGAGVAPDLATHAADLGAIASAYASAGHPVTAVGHSIGGTIVLAAAVSWPKPLASVGAYEPSLPWLGFHPAAQAAGRPDEPDPGAAAERFFRRMTGTATWERLSGAQRAQRRADGPALVADLASLRAGAPFDARALSVPAVVCAGGPASFDRHRQTADWLAAHVAGVHRLEIAEAGHGAHLSHPDAFAELVRAAVGLGSARERLPNGPGT